MMSDIDVFFVSKAMNPPFDDSGKVLPFLIATRLPDFRFHVPVNKGERVRAGHVHSIPVFSSNTAYRAGMVDKVALFSRALFDKSADVLHFFFSPNRMGNTFGRVLTRLKKGVPSIQTIMSLPMAPEGMRGALFADWVVTWSELGKQWAEDAAMAMPETRRPRIVHIPPGIVPLKPLQTDIRAGLRKVSAILARAFGKLYSTVMEASKG